MSAGAEASQLIRRCAEPISAGESVKAQIRRASRIAGLAYSRARSLWYQEARRIEASEMDALRQVANRKAGNAKSESDIATDAAAYSDFIMRLEGRLDELADEIKRLSSRLES